MFGVSKERILKVLDLLQLSKCAYMNSPKSLEQRRCDCKFLAEKETTLSTHHGESGSTCPELSVAYRIIKAMTEKEYVEIAERAGVELK